MTAGGLGDAAPAGYVVLTTVNRRFLLMFDLWFRYYVDVGIGWPVHVAAIGAEACVAMQARVRRGQPLAVHPLPAGRGLVPVRRFLVVKALLDRGFDVVLTDLDAFWLSDGVRGLPDRRFDLQASIAYKWPPAAVAAWGFSLCCGFVIIHSTVATRRLMRQWIAQAQTSDDQHALNHILMDHGMRWEHSGRVDGNEGACGALNLTVEAIDYRAVTRTGDVRRVDRTRVRVFHGLLPYRLSGCRRVLRSIGMLCRLQPRLFLWGIAVEASLRLARRWILSMVSAVAGRRDNVQRDGSGRGNR